jgi:NAD(P)H-flavin reductase
MIATNIRNSPFKQKLLMLKEGDEVKIEGPYQDEFVIKDSPKHVFVTKGIGITPVRSMALYLLKNSQNVTIYYQPDEDGVILFKEDLGNIMKIEQISDKIFKENQDAMFYISGEPEFTKIATKIAVDNGIKAGKIVVEPFSGY